MIWPLEGARLNQKAGVRLPLEVGSQSPRASLFPSPIRLPIEKEIKKINNKKKVICISFLYPYGWWVFYLVDSKNNNPTPLVNGSYYLKLL